MRLNGINKQFQLESRNIKILATTLGETGGDALSMSMNFGYLISTEIFAVIFIIATTTVGTTLADFADRSLGIGYPGGTIILFALLMASLFTWYRVLGSVTVDTVSSPKSEMFYWLTIMFSQTLGTALGDWTADTANIGYIGGAMFAPGKARFQSTPAIADGRIRGSCNLRWSLLTFVKVYFSIPLRESIFTVVKDKQTN